jgi:hypothetical protein
MLKPGDTFERYTIEAPLGQGGMGCVYRAHDARLGRRVALKVISDGDREGRAEADARLLREARSAAALDHANVVSIFDVGDHEGTPYIVMELVEGTTLRDAVGDPSVPLSARLARLADVARALAAAHARGLVHRDVKPENVMVRRDGVVKVVDFGIARRAGSGVDPHGETETPALPTLTVDGVKLGTPVYMAPEQIRGDALDGRTDQFAWGVVAYELLAGRLPWRGSSDAMAVMASVLTDPADPGPLERAAVPPAVRAIVLRALEKRPADRFASMDDVARALDAAARAEGGDPDPAEPRRGRAVPPEGATEGQRFSTGEVREVLARAVERQAGQSSTKLRFEDLLAVAAEAGIDPESLREATRALRAGQEEHATLAAEARRRDAWLRQQRLLFYRHAGVYVIVNAAILVLGVFLHSFTPWWVWFLPALGWGIGVAIHGLVAFTQGEEDFREHDEGMRWWRERQRHRHEERMARERRRDGRRVEVPVPPANEPRVRVAAPVDTGRERAAEAEAEAAVEEKRGRGRRRR